MRWISCQRSKASFFMGFALVLHLLIGCQLNPGGSRQSSQQTLETIPYRAAGVGGDKGRTQASQEQRGGGSGSAALVAAIIIALAAGTVIATEVLSHPDLPESLAKHGPQFPPEFNMSSFVVAGFVQGNWPMVLEYRLQRAGFIQLSITAEGVAPFPPYQFGGRAAERRLVTFNLPRELGDNPKPAKIDIRAIENVQGRDNQIPMEIYAIGVGPKAVGSVAIDQLIFQPSNIHVKERTYANYGFHSRSDFNMAAAEFLRMENRNGEIYVKMAKSEMIDSGIGPDKWVGKDPLRLWDGRDERKNVSHGAHILQVRAWYNVEGKKDWVASFSDSVVRVSE